ncbi:MAG: iron/manganese transporter [Spirochaetes bacterium]|nr:MAG: iron/manganese transporter [Spirochaetota bacterium]
METVSVKKKGWLRKLLAFAGPAYLVSIGYMDPGNWATDIEGGARFGYTLIWVILMSNLMAVLLQTLSARLGIVTGTDLAQGCRREYPRPVGFALWILAEVAIAATDLAEALGTILGLNLLFGLPLLWGCLLTACDTFLLLFIQRFGVRKMESFIIMLVAVIGVCFIIQMFIVRPDWGGVATGFIPSLAPGALFIAIGIIGATVMPHNLYLHSSLVQSRAIDKTYTGRAQACRYNLFDTVVALNAAFFVNAAILVVSASTFHARGIEVTEIQQAHALLEPILGSTVAPVAFAIALLAAGQSSTLTGTISGQVVMEGFLNIKMRPWLRRLMTRSVALVPAIFVIAISGSEGMYKLLILSQVILSLQLPFAIVPLIHFTSSKQKMGVFANKLHIAILAWIVAGIIIALNIRLVAETISAAIESAPLPLWVFTILFAASVAGLLIYVILAPLVRPQRAWESGVIGGEHEIARKLKPLRVKHIGVALEHSPGDSDVISAAQSIARAYGARITLIHVVESPGAMVFGEMSESLHSRGDAAYLEGIARELESADMAVDTLLREGDPADEIRNAVGIAGLDLLVLGSHGHRGLSDVVFGETVNSVRHGTAVPVLVIRMKEVRAEKPGG